MRKSVRTCFIKSSSHFHLLYLPPFSFCLPYIGVAITQLYHLQFSVAKVIEKMGSSMNKTEKRILCFGDSLTEGWYDNGRKFYPYTKKLAKLLDSYSSGVKYNIFNTGLSGECAIDEMTARLPEVLKQFAPLDLVIILGGTNDLASLSNAKERDLFENLRKLHEIAHNIGAKTCALTIPEAFIDILPMASDYKEYRESVNERLKIFAKDNSDKVILCDLNKKHPMHGIPEKDMKRYWDDDLHFTPAGYDRMAEIIFEDIKDSF